MLGNLRNAFPGGDGERDAAGARAWVILDDRGIRKGVVPPLLDGTVGVDATDNQRDNHGNGDDEFRHPVALLAFALHAHVAA